jgi:enolase-phosphatase E1
MAAIATVRFVLLDIEGTVAPISFVHEVLFPHARLHMEAFLRSHWNDPTVASARGMLNQPTDFSELSLRSVTNELAELMDRDAKSTPLKMLQGMIWEHGYRAGLFQSPVFPDVEPAMRRWTAAGKTVAIYSSGSVAAQKVFFQHTTAGDLTPLLSAFFDTTTGPKKSADSYRAIASKLNGSPAQMLFVSDIREELQAAADTGMTAVLAVRPGNAAVNSGPFRSVQNFDELVI